MNKQPHTKELLRKVKDLPDKPGVYLWQDDHKKILYVGKAKSLRKRVRSYFTGEKDIKTRLLMEQVRDLEVIIVGTEYEALLLENTLIKQWHPPYNIEFKDGKSYPIIRITNEEYPRIFRTRRIIFDGSTYFGPYPNVRQIDTYLYLIEKIFPLRKCKGRFKKRKTPCLYFHMGRCSGPCAGQISLEEYNRHVEQIKKLLSGESGKLVAELKVKMAEAADAQEFEKAALLRDQIEAIEEFSTSQQIWELPAPPAHELDDEKPPEIAAPEQARKKYFNQPYAEALSALQTALKLPRWPEVIEGFDISHLSGQDTVASLVYFKHGMPAKEGYRHFKLKTLKANQIDDFESMREIIARRYTRVLNDDLSRPDLILIDGGKGQVNAAFGVLESIGLAEIPVVGLAKENEEIYFPHTSLPLILDRESKALKLLQAVRDESHRFATGFQKKLRQKRLFTSIFENIKGIGPEKSKQLLKTFGSLQAIMGSDPVQIAQAIKISQEKADELLAYLKKSLDS